MGYAHLCIFKMNNLEYRYYIIFDTYEDAMAMHDALDAKGIENKISPAPLDLVEGVCCGVSLMIVPVDKDNVDTFLHNTNLKYEKFIMAKRTFVPKRDRYC